MISQRTVRATRPSGIVGGLYDISALNDETYFVNAFPQSKQQDSITVQTATASAVYTLEINGVEIKYTAPASGETTTTIAAGIAAAINADPFARAEVIASSTAAVIALESALPGRSYTASHSDAKLNAVTVVTAAATADPVGVGLLCIREGTNTELYDNRRGRVASTDGLANGVATLDVAGTDVGTVTVRVNGANHTKTGLIVPLRAALNGIDGLTVTGATTKVIITADAGVDFEIVSLIDATIDSQTPAASINDLAIGVSLRSYAEEPVDGAAGYPGNAGAVALRRGRVWVENSEGPSEGATVYVALVGADAGKFFATPGTGRVALDRDKCRFFKSRAADGLAVIDCHFF